MPAPTTAWPEPTGSPGGAAAGLGFGTVSPDSVSEIMRSTSVSEESFGLGGGGAGGRTTTGGSGGGVLSDGGRGAAGAF